MMEIMGHVDIVSLPNAQVGGGMGDMHANANAMPRHAMRGCLDVQPQHAQPLWWWKASSGRQLEEEASKAAFKISASESPGNPVLPANM